MSEAKLTVNVTGEPQVRALVDLIVRVRNHWLPRLEHEEDFATCAEEIDQVIRGISGQPAHMPEAVQQKWPSMRVVRLDGDVCEMRIGGAAARRGVEAVSYVVRLGNIPRSGLYVVDCDGEDADYSTRQSRAYRWREEDMVFAELAAVSLGNARVVKLVPRQQSGTGEETKSDD